MLPLFDYLPYIASIVDCGCRLVAGQRCHCGSVHAYPFGRLLPPISEISALVISQTRDLYADRSKARCVGEDAVYRCPRPVVAYGQGIEFPEASSTTPSPLISTARLGRPFRETTTALAKRLPRMSQSRKVLLKASARPCPL